MLHLFRKSGSRDGSPIDGSAGPTVVSHILTKFLKRLRQTEKPHLLDLGRLCGPNIEFFAQRGCKVQVEDLLLAAERDDAPAGGGIVNASDGCPAPARPAEAGTIAPPGAMARSGIIAPPGMVPAAGTSAVPAGRPGARPSRRIVLPRRTFSSGLAPQASAREAPGRGAAATAPDTKNASLPTKFDYPDETFDAIVAWDIFNFYEPAAMRLLAAEARRILRPGGLLLGYFHARRPNGPDTPRRYRILDEGRVVCDGQPGPPLSRHVYQNREIEKMFAGLSIVELYFLKNATRELLMEKKPARAPGARTLVRPATPRARFTIE